MNALPDCGHCLEPMVGYGSAGKQLLCHPDIGMDCYKLVTLYKHTTPCSNEHCVASVDRRRKREGDAVLDLNNA